MRRFTVHIMPNDWNYKTPKKPKAKKSVTPRPMNHQRRRSVSGNLTQKIGKSAKGIGNVAKGVGNMAKGVGSIGVKGIGSVAKGVGKGVGHIGKGMKNAMNGKQSKESQSEMSEVNKKRPPVPSKPPPPISPTQKEALKQATKRQQKNQKYSGTLKDSKLGVVDKEFLSECHLMPGAVISKISVGDEFNYDLEVSNKESCKPLVLAVLSNFSLGMIFPAPGYSIWRCANIR